MKQGKNVILVSNTSWYLYNFRQGVIRYMMELGMTVYCLAPEDDYTPALKALGANFIHTPIDAKGTSVFQDYKYYKTLTAIYAQIQPDIIFHYTVKPNIYGSFAAAKHKIPSVSIVSGAGIVFLSKNLLFYLVRFMYRKAAKRASELWFVNQDDKEFFVRESIVPESRVKQLPGEGIDVIRFQRTHDYSSLPTTSFNFLFSARLLWEKGVRYYVEAAQTLKKDYPNTSFKIIGFIDETTSAQGVNAKIMNEWTTGGVIEYLGALSDVKPLLDEIHCLVFPSYYPEGVPRVLLEAASMEIPIVTTDNVGCRDVVKHGVNGYICRPQNGEDVLLFMKKMLDTGVADREAMGKAGRRIILEQFDEKYVFQYYKAALEQWL